MPRHTTTKITYNPNNSQVFVHNISPTQVEICIVGEDTQISGVRLRELNAQGQQVGQAERRAEL